LSLQPLCQAIRQLNKTFALENKLKFLKSILIQTGFVANTNREKQYLIYFLMFPSS